MILVAGFDIVQDFDRFIERSRFDQYFLEASFQSTVFLDILPVFVEGRRPRYTESPLSTAQVSAYLPHPGYLPDPPAPTMV